MGVVKQRHAPAALPPANIHVSRCEEVGWAPGPVWSGAEILAAHRDLIPGQSTPWRVVILTEVSRPTINGTFLSKRWYIISIEITMFQSTFQHITLPIISTKMSSRFAVSMFSRTATPHYTPRAKIA